ncbi:MAG: GH92 family glycosyl hydrolase [Bacteroidetes bacterium]|nr:GH92 family glycosyl hydrolase [Bacteroidota bacterium]MDA1225055.1 GH92 family glycosyl hydrolase [Bacteroidota bacterium]
MNLTILNHRSRLQSVTQSWRASLLVCFLFFGLMFPLSAQTNNLSEYVNPFVGTGGHGHTFPGAASPFGMVQLSPDTRIDDSWDGCGGYHYDDSFIYGFSHTHLSGTGVSDYGDVLMMPIGGPRAIMPSFNPYNYRSNFSHSTEVAEAGYYKVYLPAHEVKAELTVTPHIGIHRYTYYQSLGQTKFTAKVLIDLNHRDYVISHRMEQLDQHRIGGWRQSKGWANNQWVFFVIEFSEDISRIITAQDGRKMVVEFDMGYSDANSGSGNASTNPSKYGEGHLCEIVAKVGISFTSEAGAMANLNAEMMGDKSFNDYRAIAKQAWNEELSKIQVTSDYEAQTFRVGEESVKTDIEKRKFYTALYHCMIHPSLASDVDGRYRGRDQQVHRVGEIAANVVRVSTSKHHKVYSVFSLWDTYRALHPLLSIIDPDRTVDFVRSFLLQYQQGGKLPVWELGSCETECMIGYHSVSVIADVILKEIGVEKDVQGRSVYPFDYSLALEAMVHSAKLKDSAFLDQQGKQLGYMGVENTAESVSKLLEYAYDDWCIARVAYVLSKDDIAKTFYARSERWKNVYDEKTGFMRPRVNGGWLTPFDPREVNNHFTEANAWQYSMYVPHDIMGMMDKLGGVKATENHLDSLFSADSRTTGRDQADISGLIGQYAHGNEPSHHMAYLYNYCGKPEKAQAIVDRVCKTFYKDSPDGLIGNEDCGQMSAWYVMSAMGIYAVCPGSNVYTTGVPQFYEVEIQREGKTPFYITRGSLSKAEKTAEPMMFQDGVRPWAAHQMEMPKESELPALPSINDMKGTLAQRKAALEEMKQQRVLEMRNMRKVFKAAELTVSHQQLMQGDGLVFGQVADADRNNLLLKTPKQTMVTGFVSVPVLEGSRTFRDSLRIRVWVPKGTNGVLVIRVTNMEMQATGVDAGGKATGGAKKKKQKSKKGALDLNSIQGMLIFGENREEIITLDADGEKPYEFLIGYDAVVSAQLVDVKVYGGLPGSNPGNVVGKSDWATAVYNRKENNYKVSLGEGVVPHPQYSAGGLGALVDEIQGSIEWRAGGWMGFYDQDFSAVIDMGSVRTVSEVSARFLQDSRAWILYPRHFSVMTSTDGVKFTPWAQEVALKDDWQNNETRIDQVTIEHTDGKAGVEPIKARYVKVVADKYGKLPEGHLGYPFNGSGYIFMDEIQIR